MLEKVQGDFAKKSFLGPNCHVKSSTNRSKNREQQHSQQKSMKKRSLGRLFREKVDVSSFWESQEEPKIGQNLCPLHGKDVLGAIW